MVEAAELRKIRFLHSSSGETLEHLSRLMTEKTYAAGETIIGQGEHSESLFLIAQGLVRVVRQVEKSGEHADIVARIEAGEIFGELSFFERLTHSAMVVAEKDTRVFVFSRAALDDLVKKDSRRALEQVLALFSGVCSRLRDTTRELVTVVEVARIIGSLASLEDLLREITGRLRSLVDEEMSVAFYKWNPFNDEYFLMSVQGPARDEFEPVIDPASRLFTLTENTIVDLSKDSTRIDPLHFEAGQIVVSRIDTADAREGLFLFYSKEPHFFRLADRQLIDTVSSIMAPALVTARMREEETARRLMERNRQMGYSA